MILKSYDVLTLSCQMFQVIKRLIIVYISGCHRSKSGRTWGISNRQDSKKNKFCLLLLSRRERTGNTEVTTRKGRKQSGYTNFDSSWSYFLAPFDSLSFKLWRHLNVRLFKFIIFNLWRHLGMLGIHFPSDRETMISQIPSSVAVFGHALVTCPLL